MSEITEGAEELPEEIVDDIAEETGDIVESTDEVGLTSDELETGDDDEKKSWLKSMTVYDAMLLVSLVCIGMATLLLLLELSSFGSSPWSTEGL